MMQWMMNDKPRVLIVEDEYPLYKNIRRSFEQRGYEVIAAGPFQAVDSYEAVVALIKAGARPDLAVLDIELTGEKDGFDVGHYLSDRFYLPIIFLTGLTDHGYVKKARALNAQFLIKSHVLIGDKAQLWAAVAWEEERISAVKKLKEEGGELCVKIIDANTGKPLLTKNGYADEKRLVFIKWNEILFIRGYNAAHSTGGNNEVILHSVNIPEAWIYRKKLLELEQDLPSQFVRFNRSEIVNGLFATPVRGRSLEFKVAGQIFTISEKYKDTALRQLRILNVI